MVCVTLLLSYNIKDILQSEAGMTIYPQHEDFNIQMLVYIKCVGV